jgi:hypothetical protein
MEFFYSYYFIDLYYIHYILPKYWLISKFKCLAESPNFKNYNYFFLNKAFDKSIILKSPTPFPLKSSSKCIKLFNASRPFNNQVNLFLIS